MRRLLTVAALQAAVIVLSIAPAQAARTKLQVTIDPTLQPVTVQTEQGPVTIASMTWHVKCPKRHHFTWEAMIGTEGEGAYDVSEKYVCTGKWQTLTTLGGTTVPAEDETVEGSVYLRDWETSEATTATRTLTVA